jgi:voltage-gated potassium channel
VLPIFFSPNIFVPHNIVLELFFMAVEVGYSPEAPRPFLSSDKQSKLARLRELAMFTIPTRIVNSGDYEIFRYKVYLIFEEPTSSFLALLVNGFLTACILGSMIVFAVETIPSQEENQSIWWGMEIFFVSIFISEYMLRFWSRRTGWLVFMTRPMNVIDLLSVLPFFLEITVLYTGGYLDTRFLRAVRLLRLFKFGRHSTQLQLIVGGLRKSIWPLALVFLMLSLALVMFGTAMYMVERGTWSNTKKCYVRTDNKCSPFESIPQTFWWGIATLTTVGYGDVYPITVAGRMVAGFAMIAGIICVALPTTVLGVQFSEAYADLRAQMEMDSLRDAAVDMSTITTHQKINSERDATISRAANRLVGSIDLLNSIKRDLETVLPQIRADLLVLANPEKEIAREQAFEHDGDGDPVGPADKARIELEQKAGTMDCVVERSVAVLAANSVNSVQNYINFILATTEEYFTIGSNQ